MGIEGVEEQALQCTKCWNEYGVVFSPITVLGIKRNEEHKQNKYPIFAITTALLK